MKERPILFNGEMVRALLDGRKTQTRRVVKFPKRVPDIVIPDIASVNPDGKGDWIAWSPKPVTDEQSIKMYPNGGGFKCPYGRPGDLLWVRETWTPVSWMPTIEQSRGSKILYKATPEQDFIDNPGIFEGYSWEEVWSWKPSIHMPRWASRLTLRVTAVRVERVQEISNDDAFSEGIETDVWDQALVCRKYDEKDAWFQVWDSRIENYSDYDTIGIDSFRTLWNQINASRGYSWDSNPWVWVVEFERVEQ